MIVLTCSMRPYKFTNSDAGFNIGTAVGAVNCLTPGVYIAMGGCIFNLILMIIFEKPFINFSVGFILGMSHQIFLVSFGAFTILMILIKD